MGKDSNGFVRNHFESGMLLSAEDLTNLQDYFDGKRRKGYSGLIGYGVIFGLTVEVSGNMLTVQPGLAIDFQGREIYVPSASSISVSRLFPSGSEDGRRFIYIEYAEEPCGEAFLISENNLKETVHNRVRETYRLTVGSSLEDQRVCIADVTLRTCANIVRISNIDCSPASFHPAALWKDLLPRHKSGLVYINKDDLPDQDGIFRTDEIPHGLGIKKNVRIELSVKAYDKWREFEIFGDSRLFDAPIQLASKLFPATGTFVIAVRPRVAAQFPLCIRWYASALQEDDAHV